MRSHHHSIDGQWPGSNPSRRQVLTGMAVIGIGTFAGCLGGESEDRTYEPIDLTDGQTCAVCGMEIAAHHGPAIQAYYDESPSSSGDVVAFDSVHEFISFDAEQQTHGNDRLAAFGTDYSKVEFTLTEQDDAVYISTHATADVFADITELYHVIGSEIRGAMGHDAIPFSEESEATSLAQTYGGSVVEWSAVHDHFA